MRTRTSWLALLLSAGLALAPGGARGQDYSPPDPVVPLPLYHDRPETGGLFMAGEFLFFRETNPLKPQTVAYRGLRDFDGSISADINGTTVEPLNGGPPFILPGTGRTRGLLSVAARMLSIRSKCAAPKLLSRASKSPRVGALKTERRSKRRGCLSWKPSTTPSPA